MKRIPIILVLPILLSVKLLSFAQNLPPVAVDDTITVSPGIEYEVNVLRNDYDPEGDSIFLYQGGSWEDSTMIVKISFWAYESLNRGYSYRYYSICDLPLDTVISGKIHIIIENADYYDSLDINNLSARFNCVEGHFWDFDNKAQFFAPKAKRTTSMFANSLWIGGLDDNQKLKMLYTTYGERYFIHGPISNTYDSIYDQKWFHMWKLDRSDINYHKTHWWQAGYEPIEDILTWPGNGNVENGELARIAPFDDWNQNGKYEPLNGDCPQIIGDQALFFVYNDVRTFAPYTNSISMGIEIHAMAYAFNTPSDSALWNTVFLHYDIINRSDTTYHDVFLGLFSDYDIGRPGDDFLGCDVYGGFHYGYNGVPFDPDRITSGGDTIPGYGDHPPAMGVMILGGHS